MQLNVSKIRQLRTDRGWTQQQLADICGLSLRTIQRVELQGIASLETTKSLAAAFELDHVQLKQQDDQTTTSAATSKPIVPLWLLPLTFVTGAVFGAILLHVTGT